MSEKLEINSRHGDFVHANQNMASNQGFSCVSKLWYDKTMPIADGIDKILDESRNREDLIDEACRFDVVASNDGIKVAYTDGREFAPTNHAIKQLAYWFNVPQTVINDLTTDKEVNGKVKFKRDSQDTEMLVSYFNNGRRSGRLEPNKKLLFRTYNDGTLRAVLSEIYGVINNVWYLETIQQLFKELGGDEPRLSHWRGNADTIYGNILIPDTCRAEKDSDYGGMFSISNCEIGIRRLSQTPSVFRAICMNGCIWDQNKGKSIRKKHRGEINLDDLRTDIVANIHSQIPLLNDGVERFLKMREFKIPQANIVNAYAQFAEDCKLQPSQLKRVLELVTTTEQDNTDNLFGMVNGLTRWGQEQTNELWIAADEQAGKFMYMNNDGWSKFLNRASGLEYEVLEKYGLAV